MKINLYILSFLLLFINACENETIIAPESTYNELLVVQSELKGNTIFPGVRLTKTLPVGESFTIEKAEVKDAILYLRIDGIRIVPLQYTSEGIYEPLYRLSVRQGEVYELFGERGDQKFYAKTIVPYSPDVLSANYNYFGQYAEATVTPVSNQVYAAIWIVNSGGYITADNFYNVSIPGNIVEQKSLTVRSSSYPEQYQTSTYNGRRYIQVFTFDTAFDEYFRTSGGGETVNNPYVKGSGNTIWNVKGEKVIGMFIGFASSPYIFIN